MDEKRLPVNRIKALECHQDLVLIVTQWRPFFPFPTPIKKPSAKIISPVGNAEKPLSVVAGLPHIINVTALLTDIDETESVVVTAEIDGLGLIEYFPSSDCFSEDLESLELKLSYLVPKMEGDFMIRLCVCLESDSGIHSISNHQSVYCRSKSLFKVAVI